MEQGVFAELSAFRAMPKVVISPFTWRLPANNNDKRDVRQLRMYGRCEDGRAFQIDVRVSRHNWKINLRCPADGSRYCLESDSAHYEPGRVIVGPHFNFHAPSGKRLSDERRDVADLKVAQGFALFCKELNITTRVKYIKGPDTQMALTF